ncbi:MAG: lactate utilization protein [Gammaproteobacteria bacterium]
MKSAGREAILARIREQLRGVETVARPRRITRPRVDPATAGRRFVERLKKASASVAVVERWSSVGESVALYLHGEGLPLRLVRAPDAELDTISWPDGMEVRHAQGKVQPQAGLSLAVAGVVESGTLVLASGPDNPTSLNFLSDHHIVVLPARRLVLHLEDVWPQLRKRGLPRAVNFITGPSLSADVEQTLQLGAHGPRKLHVIVVKSA